METKSAVREIDQSLLSTYQMVKLAFPECIDAETYLPLVAVLAENMSQRGVAEVIGYLVGKDYVSVYNDVLLVLSDEPVPALADVERVKQKLLPFGYEKWLQEE